MKCLNREVSRHPKSKCYLNVEYSLGFFKTQTLLDALFMKILIGVTVIRDSVVED